MTGSDVLGQLLPRFERLLVEELGAWALESARTMIGHRSSGWVAASSAPAAAVIKRWAAERFGVEISFHGDTSDVAAVVHDHAQRVVRESGRPLKDLFRVLGTEYAFHQYYLCRLHGWGDITLRRGMGEAEYRARFRNRRFRPNAVASFALERPFSQPYRVEATVPIGRVLKAYWQGRRYLLPAETEYLVIGGEYRATRMTGR